jgi:hypothetical protein
MYLKTTAVHNSRKPNTTLTVLWLDSNRISHEGVHASANAPTHHNKTLSVPYFELYSLTKEDNQQLKSISNEKKILQINLIQKKVTLSSLKFCFISCFALFI